VKSILILASFLSGCVPAVADPADDADAKKYQDMAEAAQTAAAAAREEMAKAAREFQAVACRYRDQDAVAEGHPDVPEGWPLPGLIEYMKPGATCSQIPVRLEAERRAEEAIRLNPEGSENPAPQCFWSIEEIWAEAGGPLSSP